MLLTRLTHRLDIGIRLVRVGLDPEVRVRRSVAFFIARYRLEFFITLIPSVFTRASNKSSKLWLKPGEPTFEPSREDDAEELPFLTQGSCRLYKASLLDVLY